MIDLSVIIPCYNKEQYLDECVQSVVQQTKKPKEIIILHDGCKEPMAHVNGITVIYPENRGVVKVRDEGVRISTGTLLLFLDADDKISPDFIERGVLGLVKHDVSYPNILWWYDQKWGNNRLGETPFRLVHKEFIKQCFIPVTCLIKRTMYEDLGGFRNFSMFEDWDFWLRAMCKDYTFTKFESLLWYRQYPNTRNRQDVETRERTHAQIAKQFYINRGKLCQKGLNTRA